MNRSRMILSLALLAAPCVGWIQGCSTPPIQLTQPGLNEGPWTGTAALLNYTIVTDCTLFLKNAAATAGGRRLYALELNPRRHFAFFEAPVAQYQADSLKCADGTKWEVTDFLKGGFSLTAGQINYLGLIEFRTEIGDRGLSVVQAGQKETTLALMEDLKTLPARWHSKIFNPFTNKPITAKMLEVKNSYQLSVQTKITRKKGEKPSIQTASLVSALQACDNDEQRRFPYRIGTLRMTATYQDGKYMGLRDESSNSFSDEFIQCLEKSLKDYKAAPNSRIEVTLTL
ncbi:MAG: hypothetical protein P4M08_06900 [Oligoflexia bacterium]|nr:hypothetical protein [Oligoflexia bacterium]